MTRVLFRRLAVVAAGAALLGAVACEPIVNAPPGGGTVAHQTFRLGPFDLAAMGQAGDQDIGSQGTVPRPSGAFGIKSITFDLVDANGDPIPRHMAHLHHVLLMNNARRDQFCSRAERFAGAGAERTPMSLPDPYAYMVSGSDTWSSLWHIMNTSDEAQQVYIQYDIGYQPGATTTNSRPVTPFFLDVTGCGNSEYDVPGDGGPGSVHTNTRTFTAPWDGYLVNAGGHLHEGGIDITIRDDANGHTCTMVAHYEDPMEPGMMNPPHDITTCPVHEPIHAGGRYSVISRYDNSMPREGVMGIVLGYGWRGSQ
jgi:hypothetical protein